MVAKYNLYIDRLFHINFQKYFQIDQHRAGAQPLNIRSQTSQFLFKILLWRIISIAFWWTDWLLGTGFYVKIAALHVF